MELFKYKGQMWKNEEDPIYIEEIKLPKDHKGWLVLDSLGYGSATGGTRLGEKVKLEEIKLLSNEMTLKRLFYNQPIGGAKAGICCPNVLSNNEREYIFRSFGRALKPLLERKICSLGTDMGTTQKDVENLYKGAEVAKKYDNDPIDSSHYTAISVFSAMKTLCNFHNLNIRGSRLGIQGLGHVGLKLLRLFSEYGIKLVAGSTQHGALYSPEGLDVERILDLSTMHGDKFVKYYDGADKIGLEEFFEKDMDIMCPCAGIHPINKGNKNKIQAKIIVPGCNVAATKKVEKQLYERGITYLPGFVCNAGGVLGFTLKRFGIEKNERNNFLSRGIQCKVRNLLEQTNKGGKSPAEIARNIVLKNHEKFSLESEARANMNGKLSLFFRLKNHSASEIFQTILWKLIERKLIAPNSIRNFFLKKIVFARLFKD